MPGSPVSRGRRSRCVTGLRRSGRRQAPPPIASAAMVACAPWGAAGEFAASRHGALTRSQAAENGHQQARSSSACSAIRCSLRAGARSARRRRIGADVAPAAVHRHAGLARRGVAGFRSAAALHRSDGYPPGPVELAVASRRRRELEGVVHRQGPMGPEHALDFTEVDGIRCTGIARTLCDLGSVDPPERVRLAFEWAWRNGYSLTWMRQTAERLHRPGQRGTGVLLRLLDQAEHAHVADRVGAGGPSRAGPRQDSRAWSGSSASSIRPDGSSPGSTSPSPS